MVRTVKKPEERRLEIVSAARRLFQTKDYESATMRDIMDTLGIAKGTIYHYFKSKEDLLEAVVENIVDEDITLKQALVEKTHGNALDKLRVLITSGNLAEGHDEILVHLHRPGNVAMHTRLLAVAITRLAPLYESLFRLGCQEGIFQVDHPLEYAEFLLAGVQFLTDIGIYSWTRDDLMRRVKALPALVEAQLNAPKGSFDFLLELIG